VTISRASSVKFDEDFFEKIDRAGEEPDSVEADSDRDYGRATKKHRLFIQRLDHLYAVITHPAFIFVAIGIISAVFAVTRYIGIFTENELVQTASRDLGRILSYVVTVVVAHIFTRFLENRKKRP